MGVALLSGVILALVTGDLRLEGSAGAAGGYDTNLTLAPAGEPSYGSSVATAWAALGAAGTFRGTAHLYAGVRYDGALHPDARDLDSHAGALELLWMQELGARVALIVAPATAWLWYRDAARSGPAVSARAVLRVKPAPWLAVRGGYAYHRRWADDEVYATTAHRLLGEVEVRLSRWAYLAAGYAHVSRDATFYAEVATATGAASGTRSQPSTGAGQGGPEGHTSRAATAGVQQRGPPPGAPVSSHRGTGIYQDLVPYRASVTEETLSASLEAAVWRELYLFATYAHTWGSNAQERYVTQSVLGGVGYRF